MTVDPAALAALAARVLGAPSEEPAPAPKKPRKTKRDWAAYRKEKPWSGPDEYKKPEGSLAALRPCKKHKLKPHPDCEFCAAQGYAARQMGLMTPYQIAAAQALGVAPDGSTNSDRKLDREFEKDPAKARAALPQPTPDQRAEMQRGAHAELMRRHLRYFVHGAFEQVRGHGTKLDWNWHLSAVCDELQAQFEDWLYANGHEPSTLPGMRERVEARWRLHKVCKRKDEPEHAECAGCETLEPRKRTLLQNRKIFNLAPTTLKSEIIMVCFPAWVWLHHPSFAWACGSISGHNVTRDSDAHRDLVRSPWYREMFQIQWEVRGDIDAKELWSTTAGGSRTSRNIMASWTGTHADGVLLDDPDDAVGVFGKPEREKVRAKFRSMSSRVKDHAMSIFVVVQQNVHAEDLSTWLYANSSWSPTNLSGWGLCKIPVEFNPKLAKRTPYGWRDPRKKPGENMHPLRFTDEVIAKAKTDLGTFGYEAQYNQNPEVLDGGDFERGWFRFFVIEGDDAPSRPRPPLCRSRDPEAEDYDPPFVLERDKRGALKLDFLAISVDATFGSLKKTASQVGLLVIGGQGNRRFLFEDRTKKMTYLQTEAAIEGMITAWGPSEVLIEKKANGAAIIEALEKKIAEGKINGPDGKPIICKIIAIEPKDDGGGKAARAAAAMPVFHNGLFYVLDGALWADDYIGEMAAFPNGRNDDRVDATTQAINHYKTGALTISGRWEALAGFGQALAQMPGFRFPN